MEVCGSQLLVSSDTNYCCLPFTKASFFNKHRVKLAWKNNVARRKDLYVGILPRLMTYASQSRQISVLQVSNSASGSSSSGTRRRVPLRKRGEKGEITSSTSLETSSSAMEQLDFERGVCIPFRKYTPETVCKLIPFVVIYKK